MSISAQQNGCCVELLWGRSKVAELDAQPSFELDGVRVIRVYHHGGTLNAAHASLILNKMATRDTLCAISRKILSSPNHISKIMGMDGLELIVTLEEGKFVSVEFIDEVKTTRSRNALFGTYMLSEDLFKKGICRTFRIIHPSAVHINQNVLSRMRNNHNHVVKEVIFDPSVESIREIHAELFPERETPAAAKEDGNRPRHWQNEQNQTFVGIARSLSTLPAVPRILRLQAMMGAGKSRAIAMNMRSAPKVFQVRVVSTHSVAGLKHLMREMMNLGVQVEECDYKTSRYEGDETAELVDDCGIRKIASMIGNYAMLLSDNDAPRPPVLGCLHQTMPVLLKILMPLLHESCRMLYKQDESHEFSLCETIAELIKNPYIVTVQVSGTFYDSDLKLLESFRAWCVEPYYQYTYEASIRDGHCVPLDVYLFECSGQSRECRVQKLIDILTLYPGTTIVVAKGISEARSMLLGLRSSSLGYKYMACVHSDMHVTKASLDGASSPEEAIRHVNSNSSEPAVLITVLMARSSVDIPSAVNFVDFTHSSTAVDHLRQKQGRVLRFFSHKTDRGSANKTSGRYFVDRRQADMVQHSKQLFGEENISIFDIAGNNIEDMIAASVLLRARVPMPPTKTAAMQRVEYRLAFHALAEEATKQIWTKKDRKELTRGVRWICVPFLSGRVTADLRSVVDDIVKVYKKKKPNLTLSQAFSYPPFAVDANEGRVHQNVKLKGVRFTAAQKARLRDEFSHPIDNRMWTELERASHSSDFKQLKTLWLTGTLVKDGVTVKTPTLRGCDMSIDVDHICDTELQDDGTFCKKGYLRWIMQRIKLKQMALVEHPLHEKYAKLENDRIARMKSNATLSGQKRMIDYVNSA